KPLIKLINSAINRKTITTFNHMLARSRAIRGGILRRAASIHRRLSPPRGRTAPCSTVIGTQTTHDSRRVHLAAALADHVVRVRAAALPAGLGSVAMASRRRK